MGQLFDRISRVIRAELNSNQDDHKDCCLKEGTALVAGGAVKGASVGKVGVLAGGTGYSLGAIPLAALGALTGAALYEALRSLIEEDPSSASTAAIGAAAGAATSAAIGGVGVAIGGSAIGMGMGSMAAGGAVVGLGLIGLNRLLQQGIDPEELLDRAIVQMETDAQNARQAIIDVMASRTQIQQQYKQAQAEVHKWTQQSQFALQQRNQSLLEEALNRKQMYVGLLNSLQEQLQEPVSVKNLKHNLGLLEAKLSNAKMMKSTLKAQTAAAKANAQLQSTVSQRGTNAVERMEENLLHIEARSQTTAELSGDNPERQLDIRELDDLDAELTVMKMQLLSSTQPSRPQLPDSETSNTPLSSAIVDAELEELQRMLDQL